MPATGLNRKYQARLWILYVGKALVNCLKEWHKLKSDQSPDTNLLTSSTNQNSLNSMDLCDKTFYDCKSILIVIS
jgi:hypothetical protein